MKEVVSLDIEQKLDLIQQIHREQEENERYIYDNLRKRSYKQDFEHFNIYSENYRNVYGNNSNYQNEKNTWSASFRFRLLVSMLLFLCFFVMDKKDIVYGEVNSSKIMEYIECSPDMNELMSYFTLETD